MALSVRSRLAAPGTEWGESIRALSIAVVAALTILLVAPPPGDAAAHLYRTWLVERGVIFWDNFWFAGDYPILTYSPLYYFIAALVGNTLLMVSGVLIAAVCFGALAVHEWGTSAAWPSRIFAVCAAGPLITGTAPYGLGLAAALASLLALQRGRRTLALALAAITLAFSALAFFFLTMTLGAVLLSRTCDRRQVVIVAAGLAAIAGCWGVTSILYPGSGRYPFSWWTLLIVVPVSGCGIALAIRAPGARLMAVFFGLWLLSSVTLYVVPTPVGENVTRLRYVVFPLMLLTVLLGGSRPRVLAVIALAGAAAYNAVPYVASLTVRVEGDGNSAEQTFWQPTIDFLTAHGSPDHLVAVVATGAHWEAYYLPKDGIPIVRGWYRQIDIVRNGVLYDNSSDSADYLRWLHDNAVRYVVVPHVRLDSHTGDRETRLLNAAATSLVLVLDSEDVSIYELPDPVSLLTGPADARISELTHSDVRGVVAEAGTYRLRLSWSPHWHVLDGAVTLAHDPVDGKIILHATAPGSFRLTVDSGL